MKNKFRNNDIIHTEDINSDLKKYLNNFKNEKVLVLTDNNCIKFCYPLIKEVFNDNSFLYETQEGEQNKIIKTVEDIWNFLIKNNFNRDSLIINLGGGVLTDLGGFASSTFKRGIRFINIPTTLLAQIDASIGGKTGINYKSLKNEIGVFSLPDKVFISPVFLKTLKQREFLSGFAEMIKHALLFNKKHLNELKDFINNDFKNQDFKNLLPLIKKSISVKEHYVTNDFNDKGIRKVLNFGHTFGHAFESLFNTNNEQIIKHGEAVAMGIICELYISSEKTGFNTDELNDVSKFILSIFNPFKIQDDSLEKIYHFMLHDKKNNESGINCILLKKPGAPIYNQYIDKEEIYDAIRHLNIKNS